jgi:O-antigen ligase
VFSEPASFGIFQSLGFAYLLFQKNSPSRLKDWRLIVVFISILLSLSLSSYFLLLIITTTDAFGRSKLSSRINVKPLLFAGIIILLLSLIYTSTPLGDFIDNKLFTRVENVFMGQDRSAMTRLLGSWELSFSVIDVSPVLGSGLGNLDVISQKGPLLRYADPSGRAHNIYAYILGSLGPIGLMAFLMLTYSMIRIDERRGTILATSFLAYGGLLDPVFWVYLCLYNIPDEQATVL